MSTSYEGARLRIARLRRSGPQQGDDFIVRALWKVPIERSDGLELLRGVQADYRGGQFCHFLQRVRRRTRYRTDQMRRVPDS